VTRTRAPALGQINRMKLRDVAPLALDADAALICALDEAFDLVADVTVLRGDDHHVARWF